MAAGKNNIDGVGWCFMKKKIKGIENRDLVIELLEYYNSQKVQKDLASESINVIGSQRLVNNIEDDFDTLPDSGHNDESNTININDYRNLLDINSKAIFFKNLKKGLYTILFCMQYDSKKKWGDMIHQITVDITRSNFITNGVCDKTLDIVYAPKLSVEDTVKICDYYYQYFYGTNIIITSLTETNQEAPFFGINESRQKVNQLMKTITLKSAILGYILGLNKLIGDIENNILLFTERNYNDLLKDLPSNEESNLNNSRSFKENSNNNLINLILSKPKETLKSIIEDLKKEGIDADELKKYVISIFNKIYNLLYLMSLYCQQISVLIMNVLYKNLGSTFYGTPNKEVKFIDKKNKKIVIIKNLKIQHRIKPEILYSVGYSILSVNFDPENPGLGIPLTQNIYIDFSLDELAKQIFNRKSYKYIKGNLDTQFIFKNIGNLGKKKSLFPNLLEIINELSKKTIGNTISNMPTEASIIKKQLWLIYNSTELKRELLSFLTKQDIEEILDLFGLTKGIYSTNSNLQSFGFNLIKDKYLKLINLVVSIEYDISTLTHLVYVKFYSDKGFISIQITKEQISPVLGNLYPLEKILGENFINLYIFVLNSPKGKENHYTITELNKISSNIFKLMNSDKLREEQLLYIFPSYIIVYDDNNNEQHLLRLLLIMKYLKSNDVFIPTYFFKKLEQLLKDKRKTTQNDDEISTILASYKNNMALENRTILQPPLNKKSSFRKILQKFKPQLNSNINNSNQEYLDFLKKPPLTDKKLQTLRNSKYSNQEYLDFLKKPQLTDKKLQTLINSRGRFNVNSWRRGVSPQNGIESQNSGLLGNENTKIQMYPISGITFNSSNVNGTVANGTNLVLFGKNHPRSAPIAIPKIRKSQQSQPNENTQYPIFGLNKNTLKGTVANGGSLKKNKKTYLKKNKSKKILKKHH